MLVELTITPASLAEANIFSQILHLINTYSWIEWINKGWDLSFTSLQVKPPEHQL